MCVCVLLTTPEHQLFTEQRNLKLRLSIIQQRNSKLLFQINKPLVEEIEVPFVDKVKSLGITIDKCFTWQTQVEKTCRPVFGALHKLRPCGHFMSKKL